MDVSTTDLRGLNHRAVACVRVVAVAVRARIVRAVAGVRVTDTRARAVACARIAYAVPCRGYGGWMMFYKALQNTITVLAHCQVFGVARGLAVLSGSTNLGFTRAYMSTVSSGP